MSDTAEFAAQNGASINRYGGMYHEGRSHSHLKKLEVADAYRTAAAALEIRSHLVVPISKQ
jgi:hypothetical protein